MNILNAIKGFVGTHKLASIITASVVGVGAIGGTTVGVIHAVNNNKDDDTKVEATTNVNTTDMTAASLEGQEINPADLQDVIEEVQADGTTVIKDKNGTVVAKKDQSGKTTLTKDGGVALASGSMQASGDLANNVSNAQAQTQSYVASMPSNDVSYTASTPSPAPSNNYVAPSNPTPSYNAPVSQGCNHNWVDDYKTVHHDAEYADWDENVYRDVVVDICDICGATFIRDDRGHASDAFVAHLGGHAEEVTGPTTHTTTCDRVLDHVEHHHDLMQPAWDETVVDSPAYTYCSVCGERR